MKQYETTPKMKERSFNAIAWYLVCLALAVFTNLYYFLVINTSERLYISPLTIDLDENFVFGESVPNTVEVQVRGVSSQLDKVTSLNFRTSLNLKNVQDEGVVEAEVILEKLGFLAQNDMFEISVQPSVLRVSMERKNSKPVPVVPLFVDSVPRGYTLQGYRTVPSRVDLTGSRTEIESISEVYTEQISLASILENSRQRVRLLNPSSFSNISQDNVDIYFSVLATDIVKTYQDIPVIPVGLSEQFTYAEPLSTVSVVVQSSEEILEAYTPFLFAEMQDIRAPDSYEIEVKAQQDENVEIISIAPQSVIVMVKASTGRGFYY